MSPHVLYFSCNECLNPLTCFPNHATTKKSALILMHIERMLHTSLDQHFRENMLDFFVFFTGDFKSLERLRDYRRSTATQRISNVLHGMYLGSQ